LAAIFVILSIQVSGTPLIRRGYPSVYRCVVYNTYHSSCPAHCAYAACATE